MSEEKYKDLPTGLYWKGKKTEVDRVGCANLKLIRERGLC